MRRFLAPLLGIAVLMPLVPSQQAAAAASVGPATSTTVGRPADPDRPADSDRAADSNRRADPTRPADPDRVVDPDRRLGATWRRSADRVVTTSSDETGLHVLVADGKEAYRWRTAATLGEPGLPTDQWIGQVCLTGSGRRAVVVYAPREFTNRENLVNAGAFAAVVDLDTGAVTKLPERYSLAYHNPGCGAGETAVLSRLELPASPRAGTAARTTLARVDTRRPSAAQKVASPGQLTSAIPVGDDIIAAKGDALLTLDRRGAVRATLRTGGSPFRLMADGPRDVALQVARGDQVDLARMTGGHVLALATVPTGTVKLRAGGGGRVFAVGGRAADRLVGKRLPTGWRAIDAPPDSDVSRTGDLVVTRAVTGREASGQIGGSPSDGRTDRVDIKARLRTGADVAFTVLPSGGAGRAAPGAGAGRTGNATTFADPSPETVAYDLDGSCAVRRNDPGIQVYQPTREQVEWAADLAVNGQLTFQRAANWANNGLPAYSPQGMFPSMQLTGGGTVPAQVFLGILAQESNLWQASFHVVDGLAGNPLTSLGYYGLDLLSPDYTKIDWTKTDCGYGVGQVTSGMKKSDTDQWLAGVQWDATKQKAVALDYTVNVAAGLRILQDKWNQTRNAGLIANNGDPRYIENWWFAIWAYNTGFYSQIPQSPTLPWGVGWANNPSNPNYPADRKMFLTQPLDVPGATPPIDDQVGYDNAKHPNHWSYPERVMGFAYTSLRRYNYETGNYSPTYATAQERNKLVAQPERFTFCVPAQNACDPNVSEVPGDYPTEKPGPCTRDDLKCWWHSPVTWTDCQVNCGLENRRYTSVEPRPYGSSIYDSQCSRTGLPSNALIIDDIDSASPLGPQGCQRDYTPAGKFSFNYPSRVGPNNVTIYPGKVDTHQIGGGFGGHFWFTHTQRYDTAPEKVTGRWTPTTRLNGWAKVMVHIPDHGAHTQQAKYVINTGSGQKTRYIPTRTEAHRWVTLGTYQFANSGAQSVELSNISEDGNGTEDVAWDALAFVPLSAKPRHFVVAMGDSYGSGEGAGSYYYETDNNYGSRAWNACRRSTKSWPLLTRLPGSSSSISSRLASHDQSLDFQFVSCSGATADQMQSTSTPSYWQSPPSAIGDYGYAAEGQFREMSQIESGVLDGNTTLVLLSAGGNDAGFPDTMTKCAEEACDTASYETLVQQRIDSAQFQVRQLIDAVAAKAGNATIMLAGYPRIFASYYMDSCVFGRYTAGEMGMINRLAVYMRDAQRTMVDAARAAGRKVQFTDMVEGMLDHGTCRKYDVGHDILVPDDINSVVAGPEGEGDFRLVANDDYATCVGWITAGLNVCISRASFHPKDTGAVTYSNAVTSRLSAVGYN
ncbi:SGNH/GDSL hydrolase family protein [Micromonospora sp. NPDC049645]|uniref:golvesin C-terminal-like domain-containing protein n=1 Tax=Micromonospora sp. NPDC049645 TaxID=3155508 RepID=UPI00342388E8